VAVLQNKRNFAAILRQWSDPRFKTDVRRVDMIEQDLSEWTNARSFTVTHIQGVGEIHERMGQ
jgi:hypothetical protein